MPAFIRPETVQQPDAFVKRWWELDENLLPPCFVLREEETVDGGRWEEEEGEMARVLRVGVRNVKSGSGIDGDAFERSATQREVQLALHLADHDEHKVLCVK